MPKIIKKILCQLCIWAMIPPAFVFSLTYKAIQAISKQCYEPTLYVVLAKMDRVDNYMVELTWKIERWGYYDDSEGYNGWQ